MVAPLAKAALRAAVLTVKGERKNSMEGGIVSKVLISEGEHAKKGHSITVRSSAKSWTGSF